MGRHDYSQAICPWQVYLGDPIDVPKGDRDTMESSRLKIEAAMNDLADRADRLFSEEEAQR